MCIPGHLPGVLGLAYFDCSSRSIFLTRSRKEQPVSFLCKGIYWERQDCPSLLLGFNPKYVNDGCLTKPHWNQMSREQSRKGAKKVGYSASLVTVPPFWGCQPQACPGWGAQVSCREDPDGSLSGHLQIPLEGPLACVDIGKLLQGLTQPLGREPLWNSCICPRKFPPFISGFWTNTVVFYSQNFLGKGMADGHSKNQSYR